MPDCDENMALHSVMPKNQDTSTTGEWWGHQSSP